MSTHLPLRFPFRVTPPLPTARPPRWLRRSVRTFRFFFDWLPLALLLTLLSMALLGWYAQQVALTLPHGMVGTVGGLYRGTTSCGGESYNPAAQGVFSPTLPCGTQVMLYDPLTHKHTTAPVISQAVMFRPGFGRVADITPATAMALGLSPKAPTTTHLIVQPLRTTLEHLTALAPLSRVPLPTQPPAIAPSLLPGRAEVDTLTKNLIAECGTCAQLGQAAIARVTLNRQLAGYGGARTIRQVVYAPKQFSWVESGPFPTPSDPRWSKVRKLAQQVLTDQTSGETLGLFYQMADADHFYAVSMAQRPSWAGRLARVQLPARVEAAELKHRFYSSTAARTYASL